MLVTIDPFSVSTDPCSEMDCNGGTCVFSGGQYTCTCPERMHLADGGMTCIEIEEEHHHMDGEMSTTTTEEVAQNAETTTTMRNSIVPNEEEDSQ